MTDAEFMSDAHHSRGDAAMLITAVRKGWEIPPKLFEVAPKILGTIAAQGRPREKIAAIRALALLHEQNQPKPPVAHLHAHQQIGETPEPHDRRQALAARIARLR